MNLLFSDIWQEAPPGGDLLQSSCCWRCFAESVTKLTFSINPANEVDLGMGVSITCSMSTLHLSGTFILQHISGSSGNRTLATASSSVTFNISEVGLQDEGTYQCLFQTSVGDRDFRSPPSDPFSIVGERPLCPEPDLLYTCCVVVLYVNAA